MIFTHIFTKLSVALSLMGFNQSWRINNIVYNNKKIFYLSNDFWLQYISSSIFSYTYFDFTKNISLFIESKIFKID